MHLAVMLREIARLQPQLVILDPISAFDRSGESNEVQTMLLRMVDYLKSHGVTAVFTNLTHAKSDETLTDAGLSSLMDAWILVLNREADGEFNRELYLLKARGLQHSNQVREFIMSENGLQLRSPYLGQEGALTGSRRRAKEAEARRSEVARAAEAARLQQLVEHRRRKLEAQIEALRAEMAAEELELKRLIDSESAYLRQARLDEDEARAMREGVAARE
jgi:circadian clock protein KaiC